MRPRQEGPVSETSLLIFSIQASDSGFTGLLHTSHRKDLASMETPRQLGRGVAVQSSLSDAKE